MLHCSWTSRAFCMMPHFICFRFSGTSRPCNFIVDSVFPICPGSCISAPWPRSVMSTLESIVKEEKVPAELSSALARMLTVNSFACLTSSADQLEDAVRDALPGTLHSTLNPVAIACLKAAYHRCLTSVVSVSASQNPATQSIPQSLSASSTWTDTFPAKLGHKKVSALKTKFEADYPSEIWTNQQCLHLVCWRQSTNSAKRNITAMSRGSTA